MMVMPRGSHDWTVDDLKQLPDDGLRYELLDGMLLVSPAPRPVHQDAVHELIKVLDARLPAHLRAYFAPIDWQPDRRTSFQPDILVVRREDVGEENITAPLLLAVEVLSPSTRRKDQLLKFSKYAEAGVASYWIVDPEEPSLVAYDLAGDGYREVGRAKGTESITLGHPIPVTIVPDALVAR
ncbi:Uma2 family endonuclease [Phytoactinopolyspora halotolerans]|uniref:Uma2 family endonuclease n=1 Tax=Phytoactinopolyspora halotolerans TaxID=1981512 RepID=A0A6L9SHC8_9ACTN|nr:Uma2 family endonuclease [Phytoactinopolyspora halotolerans]NEE04064.1 Uma2 family endonuclease [Phytoactinopolyspora halotolerans]